MRRLRFALAIFMLGILATLSPTILFAQTMYISRDEVKLTEEKSPTSKVVETLRRGTQVRVIEKSDRHFKVQAPSGKTGWVFKFTLSDQKAGGGGGNLLSAVTGDTRIAAREAGTGGSIRGLKETSERYATTKHVDQTAKDAVQRMEDRVIPREELLKFQREGSVGEFSGETP
ncbi:MAG: SH3 domain-containing protein [Nitrospira sp.]|nr:SH3 domain-containing protein [Nitrospira sp.]MCP9461694.1 SH3 domain-containing protein [Nitrospira sp.]MCP9473690.1 SH3 domain-containing protein [Nitrospira sp.]